jgi:hypothetical protein
VHISWEEEHKEHEEHAHGEERDELVIEGLRYERWEIDQIRLRGGLKGLESGALLKRIGERLTHLGEHLIEEEHHHPHKHHKH